MFSHLSLTRRLLLSASLVLVIFVMLTALGLERAFQDSARSARQERLLGQVYALVGSTEVDNTGQLILPNTLPEPRLNQPGTGLIAFIVDKQGRVVWQSPSALGINLPVSIPLSASEKRFSVQADTLLQSLGLNWAVGEQRFAFTFNVSEDLAEFQTQVDQYRQSLWSWLVLMAVLLLIAQVLVLRWGLRPLGAVERELNAVEAGQQEKLQGDYPHEIKRLTDGLNSLIQHERAQQIRYRNALADLAHSLKTPLAVMKGALSSEHEQLKHTVDEQVGRMDNIVMYQLQRAATSGIKKTISKPLEIAPVLQKITAALNKVHRDKNVQLQLVIKEHSLFAGDEGDLMEMLGNLLENAYKWCRSQIAIEIEQNTTQLIIRILDDGPGVPESQVENILQRGVRADEMVPGHGIGLAVVRDIVDAYQGQIVIGKGRLGGAEIKLVFSA